MIGIEDAFEVQALGKMETVRTSLQSALACQPLYQT